MRVIYVDDERSAHINFAYNIKNRNDIFSVAYFYDCDSAIAFAQSNMVDCAFLDIELPGGNGIVLGGMLKKMQPDIELVFVTSYDEFAREAYKVGGRGYLSKPYSAEELDGVITRVRRLIVTPSRKVEPLPQLAEKSRIYAKTFGNFDLLLDGRPMHFKNARAKELLAFLVNQVGGTVSSAQIFFAMWERQEYTKTTSTYVRRTVRSLKEELEAQGIATLLISQRNSICVDIKQINCDYYDLLQGDMTAMQQYNGQYMSQYSWGEQTIPVIERTVAAMREEL